MNHMIRIAFNPYFSIPCDIVNVLFKFLKIRKRTHIYSF